jgi:hypothetical protein
MYDDIVLPKIWPEIWHGNANIGQLYKITDAADLSRVGNCWAKGRLKIGDVIQCVRKAGDSFYEYLLLDVVDYANRKGLDLTPIATFGAYQIGDRLEGTLTHEEQTKLSNRELLTVDFKNVTEKEFDQ